MNKIFFVVSSIFLLLFSNLAFSVQSTQAVSTNSPLSTNSNDTKFISYWFSWGQGNTEYQYSNLSEVPAGLDRVFVAFALEKGDNSGLTLQAWDMERFGADVEVLHQRGTKVILSTGGAFGPYPWDINALSNQQVANQYINFIDQYQLDGLDIDLEAGTGSRLPAILTLIKNHNPGLLFYLTLPSTGGGPPDTNAMQLALTLKQQGTLNYISLMNYDQYWSPESSICTYESTNFTNNSDGFSRNCYVRNAQLTASAISQWPGMSATQAKQMVINGIMIGYADDGKIVNPALTQQLTTWFKDKGYGGVMTWGLSRDQSSNIAGGNLANTSGMQGLAAKIFTETILGIL